MILSSLLLLALLLPSLYTCTTTATPRFPICDTLIQNIDASIQKTDHAMRMIETYVSLQCRNVGSSDCLTARDSLAKAQHALVENIILTQSLPKLLALHQAQAPMLTPFSPEEEVCASAYERKNPAIQTLVAGLVARYETQSWFQATQMHTQETLVHTFTDSPNMFG